MRPVAVLICALLAGGHVVPARAQAPVDRRESGRPVVAVVVEGAPDDAGREAARATFGLSPGDPFDPVQVRHGVKRLFVTGPWADVQVWAEPEGDGVRVTLRLVPDRVVADVEVITTGQVPADALRPGVTLAAGDRFDELEVADAERSLLARLRDLGFPKGQVKRTIDRRSPSELVVRFEVIEGPATVVSSLVIEGSPPLSRWEVESLLDVSAGSRFNRLVLDEGLERLSAFLVSRRHLRAASRLVEVTYRDEGQKVDLTVEVTAGPRYHVAFVGNKVVPTAYLEDQLNARKVGKLDGGAFERAERALVRYYQESGFALCRVSVDDVPAYRPWNKRAERVLRFRVEEGPRSTISEIYVEGVVSKDPEALVDDIWDFVRSEERRTTLLQRVDPGDLDELLGEGAGKKDRERPVELSDEHFGLFPSFGPTKQPVYLRSVFEAAAERLRDQYQSDGYLEVRVFGPEPIYMDDGKTMRIRFRIEEGPQVVVQSVRFAPEPTIGAAELLKKATFELEKPADRYAIEETRVRIERALREAGFPYARVTESLERWPDDDTLADVVYQLQEGPRVRVGRIRVRGNRRTQDFVVLDRVTVGEGDWLTISKVEQSRQRLLRMGLFSSVSIDVAPAPGDATVRDIVVNVRERPLFAIETGFGGSIEDGPRAFLAGELRNPLGLGIGFRGRGQVNYPWLTYPLVYDQNDPNHPNRRAEKQLPQAPLLYHVEGQALGVAELPKLYGVPFDTRVHVDAVGLREIRPSFTLMRASVLAGLEAAPFPWWRSAIELEGEASDFDCPEDLVFGQGCGQGSIGLTRRRDAGFIQQVTARIRTTFDFRDDPFRPHAGVLLSIDNEVAVGSGVLRTDAAVAEPVRVNSDFYKLSGVASGYIPLADRFTVAVSGRAGNIFPVISEDNYVPLFKRFYLGGTNSVRGFYEDEILPADHPNWPATQSDPDAGTEFLRDARNSLGGNFFVNARGELRISLIGDLDLGLFVDGGQLLGDVRNFQLTGFAVGAGTGFRYNTPVGPFAIDLGWRILDGQRRLPPLFSFERMNVHFSIGYF